MASLLDEVDLPTERKIIWVVGKSCGEGKTWLQNYIEYKYGNRRVVSGISLQTKSGNITHALTKHPLSTADIFLFNIGKSVDTLKVICTIFDIGALNDPHIFQTLNVLLFFHLSRK